MLGQVNSNKDRGSRELSSGEGDENGGGEMSVVTGDLAPSCMASGATTNSRGSKCFLGPAKYQALT